MDATEEKKRWPIALIIIAVVIASAAIIYSYRDAPGSLPVSAVSDGSNGIIVAWQKDEGIYAQRVDSAEQIKWQQGGVLICPSGSGFALQADGLGGAIITWNDQSGISDDHDDPTQEKLAEIVGVRRETIIFLEKGKYNPSLKLAHGIARALEAGIEDIFILDDD